MKEVEAKAYTTYAPLAQAIVAHGACWKYTVIIRVVVFISRTGSITTKTIAHIHTITTPQPPPSTDTSQPHDHCTE